MSARRGVLWLVMFALLAAQALGLVHSVVHSPLVAGHSTRAIAGVQALPRIQGTFDAVRGTRDVLQAKAQDREPARGWLDSLFAGHDEDSTCRLFDQLGHGDAAPAVPALVLPLVLSTFLLQSFQGDFVARWAALFDARGPPIAR